MNHNEISTLSEFHKMVESQRSSLPIYRGEGKPTWALMPKIGRCYHYRKKIDSKSPDKVFYEEIVVFEDFKRRATPYLPQSPADDWQWLAVAQHHGLPTRLLDWTENPMVAAFFAAFDKYLEDSVIYVLDRREIELALKSESPFKLTETKIFEPTHLTPRITAQAGLFSVHHEPWKAYDNPSLQRWVLKEQCLIELAGALERGGVHYASLFPELGGLAKYLKHRFLLYDS